MLGIVPELPFIIISIGFSGSKLCLSSTPIRKIMHHPVKLSESSH